MDHVAILKKSWGLLPEIRSGRKIAESRWYKSRIVPWDRIHPGDAVYFKDSGEPVSLKARVTRVWQYEISSNNEVRTILMRHAHDLGFDQIPPEIGDYILGKRYAVVVFFDRVQEVEPFGIDKKGFGLQCAWLTLPDVGQIRL